MSDADDRMDRAERIRKLRQSRETGGEESGALADERSTDERGTDAAATDETPGDAAPTGDADPTVDADPTGDADPIGDAPTVDATATDATEIDGATRATDATAAATGATAAPATDAGGAPTPDHPASSGLAPLGGGTGFSLSEDAADDGSGRDDGTDEGASGAVAATTESAVRVLEFTVGDQVYCIDIERVEEIVTRETVTRVPKTDSFVEGVVDLRGQITTILDTEQLLDVETAGSQGLLVIFAPDAFEEHGAVGWVVDEVRQVVPVTDVQVRSPPSEDAHVRGIVDREDDDELIVWIRPGRTMSQAAGGE